MPDSDDEEEDLWGNIEEPQNDLMLSANLSAVVGGDAKPVHAGEPDEGKISWVAPKFAGLSNSNTVDIKGAHWNKDEKPSDATKGKTATPAVAPPAMPPVAASAASAAGPAGAALPWAGTAAPGAPLVPTGLLPGALPTGAKPAAPGAPGMPLALPQSADGRIDWGAMMAK